MGVGRKGGGGVKLSCMTPGTELGGPSPRAAVSQAPEPRAHFRHPHLPAGKAHITFAVKGKLTVQPVTAEQVLEGESGAERP